MTYRAFVESTHKSPVKRRRMHSSSDAVTQEVKGFSYNLIKDCLFTWCFWITPIHLWNYLCYTTTVYGFTYTLHSLGNLYNPACKVHQRRTEEIRRRRGVTMAGFVIATFQNGGNVWPVSWNVLAVHRKRWRRRSRPEWTKFQTCWTGSKASSNDLGAPMLSPHLLHSRYQLKLFSFEKIKTNDPCL